MPRYVYVTSGNRAKGCEWILDSGVRAADPLGASRFVLTRDIYISLLAHAAPINGIENRETASRYSGVAVPSVKLPLTILPIRESGARELESYSVQSRIYIFARSLSPS